MCAVSQKQGILNQQGGVLNNQQGILNQQVDVLGQHLVGHTNVADNHAQAQDLLHVELERGPER
jgi:hypothetical protein